MGVPYSDMLQKNKILPQHQIYSPILNFIVLQNTNFNIINGEIGKLFSLWDLVYWLCFIKKRNEITNLKRK